MKLPVNKKFNSFTYSTIAWLLIVASLIFILGSQGTLNFNPIISTLDPDSDQYIQFVNQILGRPHHTFGDTKSYPDGLSSRSPGYPFLLLPFIYFLPSNTALAILLSHSVLFIVGLALLIKATRNFVSPSAACLALIITSIPMSWFYYAALTEWATFILLIILFASIVILRIKATRINFYFCCLTTSFLALLRPEYALFIPFVWATTIKTSLLLRYRVFGTCLAVAIFSIWPIFNFIKGAGTDSPPAVSGLFMIASALGPPPSTLVENQEAALTELTRLLDLSGAQLEPIDYLPITWLDPTSIFSAAANNTKIAEMFRNQHSLDIKDYYQVIKDYSIYSISAHPKKYILYFLAGIGSLIWTLPLTLVLFWIHAKYKSSTTTNPLFVGAISIISIHILRGIFISAINIQHLRYYAPTFFVACICVMLTVIATKKQIFNAAK